MAYEIPWQRFTLELGDLTGIDSADDIEFRFGKVDTSAPSRGRRCNTAGELAYFVIQEGVNEVPVIGETMTLYGAGILKVTAGAAITAGQPIATDNQGRAVPATTGNQILGRAVTATGAAGEVVSVLFMPHGTA